MSEMAHNLSILRAERAARLKVDHDEHAKRVFDLAVAIPLLLLTLPIQLATALLVRV